MDHEYTEELSVSSERHDDHVTQDFLLYYFESNKNIMF
jgi:hypothetical protein